MLLVAETGPVTERLHVRDIDDDEGRRLVRIIRRGSGSAIWRRAQMVLLSAQGMGVPATAKVAFTSEDRVRDVVRNSTPTGSAPSARSTKAAAADVHPGPAAGDQEGRQGQAARVRHAVFDLERAAEVGFGRVLAGSPR